jgi:inosine-uridine nucleoside N-ribohydrolase
MAENVEKVLLDTDIGTDIDDAVALAYLLSQPRCHLLGVTTVTGEAGRRAAMASAICRQAGRDDVPIHPGCEMPMMVPARQTSAAQAEALSDWSHRTDFRPNSAVEFLRKTIRAHPDEVTLLSIGPMTNVATLFSVDPQIPALLKRLVIMGGNYFNRMLSEWNVVCDPHAAAIVYGAGDHARCGEHVSFGLDVTLQCRMDKQDCLSKFVAKVLGPVRDFSQVWFRRHRNDITFHDPLAAACIFEPALCNYLEGRVTVSLDEPTLGWTIFREDFENPVHTVAQDVHPERFFEHYFDIVR